MKFLIRDKATQEWFRAPGKGLTRDRAEAHRFMRSEADLQLRMRYNQGCEAVAETDVPSQGVSND